MRPRRAALSSLRGTLCCWPATFTPTSSGFSAFHCERRLRVFERDILRLGTAMVGPSPLGLKFLGVARRDLGGRTATIGSQDSRWPGSSPKTPARLIHTRPGGNTVTRHD